MCDRSIQDAGVPDTVNSTLLAWSDIESIEIDQNTGLVRIKQSGQKGDWAFLGIGQFANLATLCWLLPEYA